MFELLAAAKPAGGAAIDQVVIATGAALSSSPPSCCGSGSGTAAARSRCSAGSGRFSERVSGLPAWAAIPAGMIVVSLLTALFGMLWDISLHIAQGRDEGPLANPAHYFILAGLFGVFAAGFLSMCLPQEKPSRVAVRITDDWYAPLGGVLIAACGAFSLIGFPLDDVWHRLFGQDVTLWGPTHLMLIGGAAMTLVGLAVLLVEAGAASRAAAAAASCRGRAGCAASSLPGAFLLGLSTFQAEFDFGVPQFRLIFHPMLIMLAGERRARRRADLARAAAPRSARRCSSSSSAGVMALLVGPVLGEPLPHFPLYLVEALLVEVVALRVARGRCRSRWSRASRSARSASPPSGRWSYVCHADAVAGRAAARGRCCSGSAMALAGALLGAWIGARLGDGPHAGAARRRPCSPPRSIFALIGYGLLSHGRQRRARRRSRSTPAGAERSQRRRCASTRPTPPRTPTG